MTLEEFIQKSIRDLSDFKITVEYTSAIRLCRLVKVKDMPSIALKRKVKSFDINEKDKLIFVQVETLEEFLLGRVELLEQKVAMLERLQRVNMSGSCF